VFIRDVLGEDAAMRRAEWDAIVVGSGIGGLTTAAYLATNGRRVLVLEAQSVLGGAAQSFKRRRVFEFNTGAHYVGDCTPGAVIPTALRGIGLESDVTFKAMDPDQFDRIVAPGFEFLVPRGWAAYERRLVETFPAEAEGVREVVRILRRLGEAMEQIGAPPIPSARELLRHARTLPALYDGAISLERLFDRHGLSDGPRAAIGYISNFVLLPREKLAAAIYAYGLHHYIKTGGWFISGSVAKLSHTLARLIRCHGGEIRLSSRVEEVLVTNGRADGVRLTCGEELSAPVIVSNADIKTTYGGTLIPAEHLKPRRTRRFAKAALSGCGFSVYLGVDIDLREHLPAQNIFALGGLDYQEMLDTMFQSTREEFDPDKALLWITSGTLKDDPSPGSKGYSSLELTTLTPQNYAFWGLDGGTLDGVDYHRNPRYTAQKARIEQALVRRTLELLPFLEGHILWQESSTMLSHEDWTLSRFGAWAGLDFSLKNMVTRPGPRTEINGLFITGASSNCGGAILGTLRGGVETAGAILDRPLWHEIKDGRVFGHGLTDKGFTSTITDGQREHGLTVNEIIHATPDSAVIELTVPPDLAERFAFTAGQYVTVCGDSHGEPVRRSYSICEPPASGRLRIGVKKVPGGVFSTHAVDRLTVGDTLRVATPRGAFCLPHPTDCPRSIVAIAAGSGITPILSIVEQLLLDEPESTCTLLYGSRTIQTTMFLSELRRLAATHPRRLRVEHYLSGEAAPDTTGFHAGRIDAAALFEYLNQVRYPCDVEHWLICGPSGLVQDALAVLAEHGVSRAQITTELFESASGIPTLRTPISAAARANVTLISGEKSSEFTMHSAGETLLDAGMRVRDDLPYSCRSGSCGNCRAHIREGDVAMVEEPQMALEDDEVSAGFVLTCLAHPLSGRVVVDFDAAP
jgi:all-trans-retinol 13,14-reductase